MQDAEQLVRSYFDAWAAGDFDALADLYTPDAEYVRSDGYSKGTDAIVAYLRDIAVAFPDETASVQAVLASPGAATVEWTEAATHTGPRTTEQFGVIEPTGKGFSNARIVTVFRFDDDGKITSQHEYYDLLSMILQLGWFGLLDQLLGAVRV